jgi:hypothetical protein
MTNQRLLSRAEVAVWLGVPAKSLATWAHIGRGPRYALVGKHARYDPADVRAWLEGQRIDPEARR